ncbi:1-acyl-sn-glycerol-3-phosphate acyltransferase [Motiliproteus sp. MSK22-1]|uniref:1-acyl-sn-glycerol-3-phosphate acyltransferase n=1 Tax=Motiliproteus sp. MSK22-1 TaxID=1897630 RepID=UPI0009755DFD|nr:1-acyl-sn-glycerol-3-phosphate acyltransferase [Motiliproteus sp. MSK22-1]OMH28419.1 acyltransferase [Motiliproteus sp. MSK22-1]
MTVTEQDPFKNIRPYNDDEVADVVHKLLATPEFISAIGRFRFPRLSRYAAGLVGVMVRFALKRQLAEVNSVAAMQDVIATYMQRMINGTTHQLSYSGLEQLQLDGAYLFISNHRDIAMDPAFVNWGLYHAKMQTVRIAIGNNLLKKPYVSDLMRLNKSFIVNRSAKGIREKLAAYMELSSYIEHSINTGHSVWIAQREGRAKDGNDLTDPAIMKMLYMSQKKQGMSFSEAIKRLNIVPVSISYEYDPCDLMKAKELQERNSTGEYQKSQYEDIDSIVKGITGFKGDVHVAFGEPLVADYETPEALAEAIDQAIIGNYYLHVSNTIAAGGAVDGAEQDKQARYKARMAEVPVNCREQFTAMYANPVKNKHKLAQG